MPAPAPEPAAESSSWATPSPASDVTGVAEGQG
jgi:hypothetical protein